MKNLIFLGFIALFSTKACTQKPVQNANILGQQKVNSVRIPFLLPIDSGEQVGDYVRDIYQDSRGLIWFATLEKGVACYNGNSLYYYAKVHGLAGNQVNDIIEDAQGNMWFATTEGVSMFNGNTLKNYTVKNGLQANEVWSLLSDSKGNIWVGTSEGLSIFENDHFINFDSPIPSDISESNFVYGPRCVRQMTEDKDGNIWFARNGYGLTKFNGKEFTLYTKKDGLTSNAVVSVMADREGNIWSGSAETRIPDQNKPNTFTNSADGGLTVFDGTTFKQFPEIEGLTKNDVYPIYEDSKGAIWVGAKEHGIYRIEGNSVQNFTDDSGLTRNNPQSILEDRKGIFWFGFSGGLFQKTDSGMVNFTAPMMSDGC